MTGKEDSEDISVSESIDVELTTANSLKKVSVMLGPRAEGTDRASVPGNRAADGVNQISQWTFHLDRGQRIQIALVGCLGYLGTPMKVGNTFSHFLPRAWSTGIAFFGTIDSEVRRIIHGGLNLKNASLLIIDLDGVCFELMFEAYPFRTSTIVADDFSLEVGMWLLAEKTHDIGGSEHANTGSHKSRVNPCQSLWGFEHNVGGPLALIGRPVVFSSEWSKHLLMPGVKTPCNFIEGIGPRGLELLVHEGLRFENVFNPGETVLKAMKTYGSFVHLTREPFATVEANPDGKWKPRLNASMHEPKDRVDPVVVEKQAFPNPAKPEPKRL